jgi:quercetin dioxygenase-like cupin family protein
MNDIKFKVSEIYDLSASIEYKTGSINSKVIIKNEHSNLTMFAFDQNKGLKEHIAPFISIIQIIEGTGIILINNETYSVEKGEFIIVPVNVPHSIKANKRFKMLIMMMK